MDSVRPIKGHRSKYN